MTYSQSWEKEEMKIRTDFVTNSSSTSFVIIAADDPDEEEFLELMGVAGDSPLIPLFSELYYHLLDGMEPPEEYFGDYRETIDNWSERLRSEFPDEVVERIAEAREANYKVYIGRLSTEGYGYIEAFFCTDSFEVESEGIYFNALNCAW
jgi:hypothetical protein